MGKSDGPNEAETLAALEEKRLDAVKLAVPQLLQLEREIAAKNKRKGEIYQGLENRGIDKSAFKEALKRARRDSEQLDLFDEEAAALEPMIRDVILGITKTADQKAAKTAQEVEDRRDKAAGKVVSIKDAKAKKDKAAAPKAAKKTASKGAGRAKADPPQGRPQQPPAGDPEFRSKINHVHAGEGHEGLSADSIPMPGAAERPPQPAQTGFVDRTERMSATDARKLIGADDDVLGHG